MDVKTYRARSLQDALQLIRADLGSQAAVLHTRELRGGLLQASDGASRSRGDRLGHRQCAESFCNDPEPVRDASHTAIRDTCRASSHRGHISGCPPADEHDFRTNFATT